MWRVSTGGWFIADEVVGKHEFIPFAVALDDQGAVKGIEILEYREAYGGQIRDANCASSLSAGGPVRGSGWTRTFATYRARRYRAST